MHSETSADNKWAGKLLIAGPCSAESEEQVLATALDLSQIHGVTVFRCGLWKPRTRPGDFEGVGHRGFPWLKRMKQETGLQAAVEVAVPAHVEACLEHGIDMLWIGARTVVNPFSMHELATSLKGVNIPVMVKNPVNPDLMLWAGALERLMMHGISSLYAIHRGFSVPGPGLYRNDPFWNIPMELRRMFPQLPLISDPSHICGHTALLRTVAQKAIDLGFDGLMIEAHIRPEEALTDRGQQLTPPELGILLDGLSPSTGISHLAGIGALRDEIDRLDDVLIEVLAKRMAVADKIGGIKKETGLEIHDPERWKALLADRLEKAARFGLDPALLKTILDEIHHHSKKRQG